MAQRSNDARYQTQASKEGSSLDVKRLFRRFILNKKSKSSTTRTANGGDFGLYHTLPRAVRSSDSLRSSRSITKPPAFATLFHRSIRERRRVESVTQTRPTENSDVIVVSNGLVGSSFLERDCSITVPLLFVADAHLLDEDDNGVIGPTLLDSVSDQEDVIRFKTLLPIPPIIISAPTPPECYPSVDIDDSIYKPELRRPDSLRSILETLQCVARQLAEDPAWTQANLFRLAAPVVVFLYILAMGIILPRKKDEVFKKLMAVERDPVLYSLLFALLGLLAVFAVLRLLIWIVRRLIHSFCDVDLTEVLKKGVCIDSEGKRVGEAGLIIGNLLS